MTLGEVGTTLNTISSLTTTAVDLYQRFMGNPDSDQVDGPAGLWDVLMAMSARAASSALMPSSPKSRTSKGGAGKPNRHHTIPVYVCGHLDQRYSVLPYLNHRELHDALEDYVFKINLLGITFDLVVFKKPTSRIIKTPTQRLGMKSYGRGAIAAGLVTYYATHGWLGEGKPALGLVLAMETPRFIGRHHSAPGCQRPR